MEGSLSRTALTTRINTVRAADLPASNANVELVSKLALKNVVPEKIADVGVFNGYAYLASWGVVTCKYNGVHVVDIRSPQNPKEVAFIASKEGSYPGEGIQGLHIDTPAFVATSSFRTTRSARIRPVSAG